MWWYVAMMPGQMSLRLEILPVLGTYWCHLINNISSFRYLSSSKAWEETWKICQYREECRSYGLFCQYIKENDVIKYFEPWGNIQNVLFMFSWVFGIATKKSNQMEPSYWVAGNTLVFELVGLDKIQFAFIFNCQ